MGNDGAMTWGISRDPICGLVKAPQRFFACVAMLACLHAAAPASAADAARAPSAPLELRSPAVLRHFGEAEGLPQVSVNAILRTQDGFLWLGTFGGLVRYDGHEFRTFRSDRGDEGESPVSRRVISLHEDDRHRLWIGTEDAGVTVYENGRFRHLPICGGTCLVYRIISVTGHDIWVLTETQVFRVDPGTLEATPFANVANGYGPNACFGNQVLIGGTQGLARLSGGSYEAVSLPDGHKMVRTLVGDGVVAWVIVEDGKLYRYDVADNRWTFVRGKLALDTRLLSDGADGLYLSDEISGTRRLGKDGSDLPLEGAAGLYAISIQADADGALWIGTPGKGLWLLRSSRVSLLRSTGVPDAPGRVVVPDGEGGVWMAMSCMSLWHIDAGGKQTAWPMDGKIGEGCIHSLLHDDATGVLWIGTSGGILARLADGRAERVAVWPELNQLGVWKTKDGRLWAADLHFVGRLRFNSDGVFEAAEEIPELAGMDVKRIVDARAGGAWVVGDRGAFRVVGNTVVERWTSAQGIHGRFFRALYEDADGTIWIGSYGSGLIRIEHGVISQYTEANGLFDDTVSCILPNADGRLWLAGNRGIGLLDRHIDAGGPRVLTLTSGDGLDPSEFNGAAAPPCADDDAGHLWFAMMIGFARVEPGKLQDWAASRVPVAYVDHAAVSQRSLDLFQPARLGVNASNLEIRYGAIDLLNPDKVRYRYRMTGIEGGEADWIDAGSNRSVLLPVVPWGSLTFEAQARELGGAWSPSATLRLERPRPWYKYQWIVLAASLASLLALLWVTRERRGAHGDYALLARLRRPGAIADSDR
jgi:ligand-binding sensor domain-containing protein